ncbi:MAG: cupredoxin domain-containing protein [Myxococcota bacterium]
MRRSLALAAAITLLAAPLAALAETVVQVGHNRLEPADVTVKTGETVRFHNQDRMPGGHTIVADDGKFSSPPMGEDESWSHTFDEAGSFPYHIEQHPSATGTVTVE